VGPSTAASCCSAYINIIVPPTTGNVGTAEPCATLTTVSFGSPPTVVTDSGVERAVVTSNWHQTPTSNVYLFEESSGCVADSPATVGVVGTDYQGISANWPRIFLASGQGFTSVDRKSGSFDPTTQAAYVSATAPTQSPPAFSTTTQDAFFGSVSSDHRVRAAVQTSGVTPCGSVGPCWIDDATFPAATATNPIPFTPVFDASNVYDADANGVVYSFRRSSTGSGWTWDFRSVTLTGPWSTLPAATSAVVSPPVLLQGQTVLVVRSDGVVALASAGGVVPLLQVALTSAPVAPVVDTRGSGGVAYVVDGGGWVTALQIAVPPLAAGQNAWPRPGRDSCNSRNAASSCQ
jgi:hypothetical protein